MTKTTREKVTSRVALPQAAANEKCCFLVMTCMDTPKCRTSISSSEKHSNTPWEVGKGPIKVEKLLRNKGRRK